MPLSKPRQTARSRLVDTLAAEILRRSDKEPFLIDSEYELVDRVKISRVTVRLALSDSPLVFAHCKKAFFLHVTLLGCFSFHTLIGSRPAPSERQTGSMTS